ncbi:phage tail tape measure C-terminal domain-containing protein [Burkholderia cepacia]|uniref:phage tail tape measure C-terminal domain-containing protein n=1 Tax=Burkholderia cepacia TaxID=292 RepID=UPI0012D93CE5|nr:phage tail tape measure C-terminal domain-containing protein [Burkholderia cepacia]
MTDKQVNVRVSADATSFNAALDSARDRITKYAEQTGRTKQVLDTFQQALDESGAATAKQVQQIAKATMQLDRMAQTAGKTQAELAALKAEQLGAGQAFSTYTKSIADATSHTHEFSSAMLKNKGVQREMLVLMHELSQGNYKAFGGSMLVMGERTGFDLTKLFSGTALAATAATAAIAGTISVVHHAQKELEAYGKEFVTLSQQTGISMQNLQQWAYVTESAGLKANEAAKSLEAFEQAQNKAAHGNKQAEAAFTALGISMQQVKALSPHDALLAVADAFSKSQDGAAKAAVAQELFGQSGEQLIPTLNQGADSIRNLENEASRLGGVLSDDVNKRLAEMKEHTEQAHARWDAMARGAKAQLVPAIEAVTGALSDNASMKPVLEDFYKGVVEVFRTVTTAAYGVYTAFKQVGDGINMLSQASNHLGQGKFGAVVDDFKNGFHTIEDDGNRFVNFYTKVWSDVAAASEAAEKAAPKRQLSYAKVRQGGSRGNENALNGQIAQYETQLKQIDQARQEALQTAKSDFDTGALTYQDYYAKVVQINTDAYGKEEELQRKRIELAQQKRNIAAAQTAQQELDRIEHEHVKAIANATTAIAKEYEKRGQSFAKFQAHQANGAAKLALGLDASNKTPFMSRDDAGKYSVWLKEFEQFEQQKQAIEDQYPDESDAAERARRLQSVVQGYTDRLKAYDSYEQQRNQIRNSYSDQMSIAVTSLTQNGKTNAEAFAGGFTQAFGQVQSAMDTFITTGKANMADLTASILADFAKIAANQAFSSLVGMGMGALGFGSSAAGSTNFAGAFHLADGGHVTGAGTGTSDSIPAMLSNGEYVVNAASTSRYRGLLESINSGQMSHFATGGYVGSSGSGSGGSSGGGDVHMHVQGGGGWSAEDLRAMQAHMQAFVDRRMSQNMRGQGGYAAQIKYGQI